MEIKQLVKEYLLVYPIRLLIMFNLNYHNGLKIELIKFLNLKIIKEAVNRKDLYQDQNMEVKASKVDHIKNKKEDHLDLEEENLFKDVDLENVKKKKIF